jgi:hypothetical protein
MTGKDLKGPLFTALSPKQALALAALVTGKSVKQAAAAAHVQPKAVWTWRQQPEFVAELRRLQQEAFDDALVDLRRATGRAVKQADGLLGHADPKVRLGAVRTLLGAALKVNEAIDLAQRVAALEARTRAAEEKD